MQCNAIGDFASQGLFLEEPNRVRAEPEVMKNHEQSAQRIVAAVLYQH